MFTVRIIYDNHTERILPALNITKVVVKSEVTGDIVEEIQIESEKGIHETIPERAVVYVMNENGKTVATYILGEGITERNHPFNRPHTYQE